MAYSRGSILGSFFAVMMTYDALVWLRKDLRVQDNPALWHACQNHARVLPIYIHDTQLSSFGAAQKWWLHHSLQALKQELGEYGLSLGLYSGESGQVLSRLIETHALAHVYWNHVYEPLFIKNE